MLYCFLTGCYTQFTHIILLYNVQIEEEELEEFELLEQAAANASFSSNSSVVVRVLAKARGNAQGGKRFGQEQSAVNKKSKHSTMILPTLRHLHKICPYRANK